MNVFRLWKVYRASQRLAGYFEEAQVSKSLFRSKVFWFNVLSAAMELSQVIPLPAGTMIIISGIINIGLRIVTDKPVHVLPPLN